MLNFQIKFEDKDSVLITTNCHIIIYGSNSMKIYDSDLTEIISIIGTIYKPYLDNLSENDKDNLKVHYPYLLTIYQNIHIRIKGSQKLLFNKQWESTLLTMVEPNYFKKSYKQNKCNYNYIVDGKYIIKIKK